MLSSKKEPEPETALRLTTLRLKEPERTHQKRDYRKREQTWKVELKFMVSYSSNDHLLQKSVVISKTPIIFFPEIEFTLIRYFFASKTN